MHWFHLALVS